MTKEDWLEAEGGRSVRPQGEDLTMKKMMTILALASALSFAACKKKDEAGKATGSAPATGAKVDDKGSAAATGAATGADPGTAAATGAGTATGTEPAGGGAAAAGGTGSAECDEYLKTFDDVVAKCKDKLGPALDAMKQSRDAQAEAFKQWGSLDEASKKATIEAAATGCKSATDAIKQSATAMGCTL
jgi:hypothetical protein